MKRFGICLDYKRNIWKLFYNTLREAKGNAGRLEEVYEINLMPAEAIHPSAQHMIVSNNENLKHLEDIFKAYDSARNAYNKNNLNITIADIFPVWKIFKINKKNNKKEKIYEFPI